MLVALVARVALVALVAQVALVGQVALVARVARRPCRNLRSSAPRPALPARVTSVSVRAVCRRVWVCVSGRCLRVG